MDHLYRGLAPISEEGWKRIDEEAARTLRHFLAARAMVDFVGPRGWTHAAEPAGRVQAVTPPPAEGVTAELRSAQALVEFHTPFELSRAELDAIDRDVLDVDLAPVSEAARRAAYAEDHAVFHGYPPGGITGIAAASPHEPIPISDDYNLYPGVAARAVAVLREAGVEGPYAIALGPRCYTGVIETTEHGGYPVLEHMHRILGGAVVWAPAVEGAVVISARGGDYSFCSGQDLSIGYRAHNDASTELYLVESFTFVIGDARAAVALHYRD